MKLNKFIITNLILFCKKKNIYTFNCRYRITKYKNIYYSNIMYLRLNLVF